MIAPDAEYLALIEDILRCARLAPVGVCEWIGPDFTRCGQPERSKGTALCSLHWSIARAPRTLAAGGKTP